MRQQAPASEADQAALHEDARLGCPQGNPAAMNDQLFQHDSSGAWD